MSEALEIRRKRLLFRSWHRGTREADLLLGPFAEQHLMALTPHQLDRYEALLQENDATLYDWITGRVPPTEAQDSDVLRLIMRTKFRPRSA
ncbi:MAG TPA: succinate dehydrogenase assembly factor 2 [Stellaceae bacterium]|nr:succinate dehydrogenase assembly factor 2 [Stellaceae bacterium]